jgi:hypothetical protein
MSSNLDIFNRAEAILQQRLADTPLRCAAEQFNLASMHQHTLALERLDQL